MIINCPIIPLFKTLNPALKKNTQLNNTNYNTTQNIPSIYDNNKISQHFAISFQSERITNLNILKAFENLDESLKDFDRNKNVVSLDPKTDAVKVTNNKELEKDLNIIFAKFPVLKQTIDMDDTHNCKIITHILEVTKELVTDDAFQQLPCRSKRLARICSMFHDIEKRIDLPNRGKDHPEKGAKIIVEEFNKFGFNEEDLFAMHQIVKNHHWISRLNKGDKTKEEIALEFKDCPDAFNIEILLSKADIKAGGKMKYINEFNDIFHPIVTSEIKEVIENLNNLSR